MSDSPTLDKLVAVSPRFARSVALVRDAHRSAALDGYILTPTGRDVLRRLSDALRGDTATRAWSITSVGQDERRTASPKTVFPSFRGTYHESAMDH